MKGELGAPSEAEREKALELCVSEPALIAKAADLARLASADDVDSRIRSAIRAWASDIIRNQASELQDWGRFGGSTPEGELSLLAKRLREVRHRAKKYEGQASAATASAEQIVRLGLVVTATRPDFDLIASLSSVCETLRTGKQDKKALDRNARKLALGASPKLLENLAALTRLTRFETEPLRAELAELRSQLQTSRDRTRDLQEKCQAQGNEIERLKSSNEALQSKLGQVQKRIEGVMGGADQDMLELRARYRTLLNRKLRPNLEEAQDGLEHDPPNIEVARHRIGVIGREIKGELEWLKQFSD
jgi:predicted  nucleic acid-binding Zn-ribbon protein